MWIDPRTIVYSALKLGSEACRFVTVLDYRCSAIRKGSMLLHLAMKDNSISATLNELLLLPITTCCGSSEAADVGLIPGRQDTTHDNGSSLIHCVS